MNGEELMFNYQNLDDIEFEELCKDIMQKELNTTLRTFGKGRDGGIDLKDNIPGYNIIVQIKHYINSDFSQLKASLKKEIEKVKKLNPKQYYICCSQKLSPQRVSEIYELFEDYMSSEKNIMTLNQIDSFLEEECNSDIVRKHFKLWLSASSILSEINNHDIFVDCETLLEDIKEESNYYVQTKIYDNCIKVLDEFRVLMLVGSPGVGKTTMSKMIILHYANQGYRVRYTTNGDISDIKRSLSLDEEKKEIILLDDCLGQYYFKLKDRQENDLITLIKYIKRKKNKIIILNSRITILNEAKELFLEFSNFITNKKMMIYTIDMDKMSILEKARIFYNHLYFNNIPAENYISIRNNKNYFKIVGHRNYNPRIIEYVTQPERYKGVPEEYFDFILSYLDNPKDIWKNEFEVRLGLVDRIFMLILFSLTATTVNYSIMEECFNRRLMLCNGIDTTINNFKNSLNRLNKSMIKLLDNDGKIEISVLNPSINDYLKVIFFENIAELENIRNCVMFYEQIERCYSQCDINEVIKEKIINNSFLNIKISRPNKFRYIETLLLYKICEFRILNETYKENIKKYIENLENENLSGEMSINKGVIIKEFLKEPLFSYYHIDRYILDINFIEKLYGCLEIDDLVEVVNIIYNRLCNVQNRDFRYDTISTRYIIQELEVCIQMYSIDDFIGELDLNEYFKESSSRIEQLNINDYNKFDSMIVDNVINMLYEELKNEIEIILNRIIDKLDDDVIRKNLMIYIKKIEWGKYDCEKDIVSYVQTWLEPGYDDDYDSWRDDNIEVGNDMEYIDYISEMFDRDIK